MNPIKVKAIVAEAFKSSIYGVAFNKYQSEEDIFAVVGGRYVIIAKPHKTDGIKVLSVFSDENDKEVLCVCAWTRDEETKEPLLAVAGGVGVVKVINTRLNKVVDNLIGHGDEIYDLKVSPVHPYILATASKDHTIRVWTLDPRSKTQPTVAILGGDGGHCEGVLTMAFHANPLYVLSGGMDHAICLWMCPVLHHPSSEIPALSTAIAPTTDDPIRYCYPHVSTTAIHTDYVDCVEFFHDFVISKAARSGRIVIWRIDGFDSGRKYDDEASMPRPPTTHEWKETRSAFGSGVERLMQFDLRHCDQWYMKFGLFSSPVDPCNLPEHVRGPGFGTYLAIGNSTGNMYVWDLSEFEKDHLEEEKGKTLSDPFELMEPHVKRHVPKLNKLIRTMGWSIWGDWLVGVGDRGLLCLWQVGNCGERHSELDDSRVL